MGRALKQALIGTMLSGVLATLMGCTSLLPKSEPTPVAARPQPTVTSTTTAPTVVKQKKAAFKKVIKPVEEVAVAAGVDNIEGRPVASLGIGRLLLRLHLRHLDAHFDEG
ncbi:hypothetical protein [Mesorhizobium sp.]|uniref:hypothetical protein n=1 Tax=Mesorhizobium sp. TaxID=1871066 RepID=UPI0011F6A4C8|nr:hypothetical protein [Mesorhizobium sp.]TIR89411.1 MAG: hypothetical protein E5X08_27710 [Mesorhizobium sp.]